MTKQAKYILDDRAVAVPSYEGIPPGEPLPDHKLSKAAVGKMLGKLFPEAESEAKAVEPIKPPGKPLRRWGRRNVPITREDVAKAIAEWDTDVPKQAQGLLMAETLTEEEESELIE